MTQQLLLLQGILMFTLVTMIRTGGGAILAFCYATCIYMLAHDSIKMANTSNSVFTT